MSRIDMIAPRTTTPAILRTAPSILSGYVGGTADDAGADCEGTDTSETSSGSRKYRPGPRSMVVASTDRRPRHFARGSPRRGPLPGPLPPAATQRADATQQQRRGGVRDRRVGPLGHDPPGRGPEVVVHRRERRGGDPALQPAVEAVGDILAHLQAADAAP